MKGFAEKENITFQNIPSQASNLKKKTQKALGRVPQVRWIILQSVKKITCHSIFKYRFRPTYTCKCKIRSTCPPLALHQKYRLILRKINKNTDSFSEKFTKIQAHSLCTLLEKLAFGTVSNKQIHTQFSLLKYTKAWDKSQYRIKRIAN